MNSGGLLPQSLAFPGSLQPEWKRCGKPTCRCARGGLLHGPYWYRRWRERGKQRKAFVRQEQVAAVQAALARWLRGVFREELVRGARCACPKTAATCQELLGGEAALWTCVRVPGIDLTNNAAERFCRVYEEVRHFFRVRSQRNEAGPLAWQRALLLGRIASL